VCIRKRVVARAWFVRRGPHPRPNPPLEGEGVSVWWLVCRGSYVVDPIPAPVFRYLHERGQTKNCLSFNEWGQGTTMTHPILTPPSLEREGVSVWWPTCRRFAPRLECPKQEEFFACDRHSLPFKGRVRVGMGSARFVLTNTFNTPLSTPYLSHPAHHTYVIRLNRSATAFNSDTAKAGLASTSASRSLRLIASSEQLPSVIALAARGD